MDFIKHLEKLAKKNCAVVGIGAGNTFEARKIIEKSIKTVTKLGYAKAKSFSTPSELISALKAGEIACAVRGTLPAKETLSELKHVLKSSSIYIRVIGGINILVCNRIRFIINCPTLV